MKRITCRLRGLDLLEHGLEALLELAAVLRARDHRAEIEREQALVLEALGHVALRDAVRDALDDRRLADAGLADEHRVVLRAARQHLHHATDLLVATDHRVDLPCARGRGEIARVLLERLELALRIRIGDALSAAHLLERGEQRVSAHASIAKELLDRRILLDEREQHVLAGGVLVLQVLGLFPRLREHVAKTLRERGLGASLDLRQRFEARGHIARERSGVGSGLLQDRRRDAVSLVEQPQEDVLGHELGIAALGRLVLAGHQRFTGLGRESIQTHGASSPFAGQQSKHRPRSVNAIWHGT